LSYAGVATSPKRILQGCGAPKRGWRNLRTGFDGEDATQYHNHLDVTIHIPDDVAVRLGTADLPRRVLEALAVEEFRHGRLTQPELRRLLGFATRQALDSFLKAHSIYMAYTLEDLENDRNDLRRLGL
jgi:hypothetical protein